MVLKIKHFTVNLHSRQKISGSRFHFDEFVTGYIISYITLKLKESLSFLALSAALIKVVTCVSVLAAAWCLTGAAGKFYCRRQSLKQI